MDGIPYTQLINFAGNLDYNGVASNGNVVDILISPMFLANNKSKFIIFLFKAMEIGFFQCQFNVVDSKTLIDAKAHPENYPNLIVRVWGFSAYFKDLPEDYQDMLIRRAQLNDIVE